MFDLIPKFDLGIPEPGSCASKTVKKEVQLLQQQFPNIIWE